MTMNTLWWARGRTTRDTNADWRRIGETQPYWGVVSMPKFRTEVFDTNAKDELYASGCDYVTSVAEDFEHFFDIQLNVVNALDFGCGVGRLSEAMMSRAKNVTGFDMSPGMLNIARSRSEKISYVDTLPDQLFDWINSYIVFQHMAPERGLRVLDELLTRLAPKGLLSLHFTLWRDARVRASRPSLWARLRRFQPPVGEIQMFDYDLCSIVQRLAGVGISETALRLTDHAGHHGVMIFARKGCSTERGRY